MARLFVAVWPPAPVLDLIAALPRAERKGVRWTRRHQWHVTLRFLGQVDDVAPVAEAVRTIAGRRTEAVLGPHPSQLGRGVLMLPVAGLDQLAEVAVAATARFGQPPEPRPFVGHVTLARLNDGRARDLTEGTCEARWTVDEIALVESTPGPDGSRYENVTVGTLS